MKTIVAACLAGLLTVGSIAQVEAETIRLRFSGIVTSGQDSADLFGGGNLAGSAFVLNEYFNLDDANNAAEDPQTFRYICAVTPGHCADAALTIRSHIYDLGAMNDVFAAYTPLGSGGADTFVANEGDFRFRESELLLHNEGNVFRASLEIAPSFIGGPDSSTIVLSAVPLPASFPLFCAALLGLGAFGLWRRRTPSSSKENQPLGYWYDGPITNRLARVSAPGLEPGTL